MLPAVALVVALSILVPIVPGVSPVLGGQDDAGTGLDAPATVEGALLVEPLVIYHGNITVEETIDLYAFEGVAGRDVEVRVRGAPACYQIQDAAGVAFDGDRCNVSGQDDALDAWIALTLPYTGLYHLRVVNGAHPSPYRFAFAFDADAPEPGFPQDLEGHDNDAGSGRDAPDQVYQRPLFVAQGVVHEASLDALPLDAVDLYAFEAEAGDMVDVVARGVVDLCFAIRAVDGTELGRRCSFAGLDDLAPPRLTLTLPADGLYFVRIVGEGPQDYAFSFALQ